MALNQVRVIIANTDVYNRYFAFNAWNLAFDSQDKVQKQTTLSADAVKTLYEDELYGLGKYSTLYIWVKAMNDGSESQTYNDIFEYFSPKI